MIRALWRWLTGATAPTEPTPASRAAEPASAPAPADAPDVDDADDSPDAPAALPGLPFLIRPFEPADGPALVAVFQAAVHTTAADHYDANQRAAWAAGADTPGFQEALADGLTMVAEWDGRPAAFAQLVERRVTFVYVHPEAARLGIATLLYHHLEDEARIRGLDELVTEASLVARDFFTFLGFEVDGEESVQRRGVSLPRWRMRKRLA
ncbi:GNAT family N-acetyltransferase [Alloalcanivorax sp. C16-2]|uniref:GNAT family N-acetyltransferase n=1 Tax=Alloalcanivorax sp. C16-2 TaxID=3390052 RepID=UPI0039709C17